MSDLKSEFEKAKKEAKPYLFFMYFGILLLLVGLVLVFVDMGMKNKSFSSPMFISSVSILGAALVIEIVVAIVGNKKIGTYNRLKKEMKKPQDK